MVCLVCSKHLVLSPALHNPGMMVYTFNPGSWAVEEVSSLSSLQISGQPEIPEILYGKKKKQGLCECLL